uniref:Uncharacterized protein n=1 Tax=Avena sativa TaxID=4498 RepID=A0ACD5XAT2_AVESA
MDRRPELQPRARTLWEQLTTPDPAIRDFLKIPHEEDGGGGGGGDADRRPCTLMDAIGRDSRGESVGRGVISWKPRLRDRLRLRRDANARSTDTSDRRAGEDGIEEKDEAPPPDPMSLMALLEQTGNHWDDDDDDDVEEEDSGASAANSGAMVGEKNYSEEREEEEMARACCVCMVRHKGAAFIPCGHTFCRLCSRELWLTRASCPLCNAFIHDVLRIF